MYFLNVACTASHGWPRADEPPGCLSGSSTRLFLEKCSPHLCRSRGHNTCKTQLWPSHFLWNLLSTNHSKKYIVSFNYRFGIPSLALERLSFQRLIPKWAKNKSSKPNWCVLATPVELQKNQGMLLKSHACSKQTFISAYCLCLFEDTYCIYLGGLPFTYRHIHTHTHTYIYIYIF